MSNKFISPLTWPGGKAKKWNLIKSYFPKDTKDMTYFEAFFGGGSVGLNALKEKLFKEYYFNDIDFKLIMFWVGISETNWLQWKHLFYPNVKDINILKDQKVQDKTVYYLMKNNLTFNGQQWGTWTQKRLEQNWNLNKFDRIINCSNLLAYNRNKINWKCDNFLDILDYEWKFDSNTFMYLDPPYYLNKGKPYRYKFTVEQFNLFKDVVDKHSKMGVKILISLDDCFEVRELFKDYYIYEAEWKYTSTNTKYHKVKLGKELFITNYEVKNINENEDITKI
ncbi:DNA adenine methylase [Spiroplasma floricola]|uniref:DNA adenine methylase n=1 Tax=Spiroplasma floricola 23-6 TaxID=1336749 RepID=A0A2K8SCR5_9MOLU|nr:DNA adenine methylase [Spiroplasma floricola]AUB31261.1 DNA adenine methylase [Spiroplasma floricola 23-6]